MLTKRKPDKTEMKDNYTRKCQEVEKYIKVIVSKIIINMFSTT